MQFITMRASLTWLLSGILCLLFLQLPAHAAEPTPTPITIDPFDTICAPAESPPSRDSTTPASAMVCAQYGKKDGSSKEKYLIRLISPLRSSNLLLNTSTQLSQPSSSPRSTAVKPRISGSSDADTVELKVIWLCPTKKIDNVCFESNEETLELPYAAAVSYNYSPTTQLHDDPKIVYTATVNPSNVTPLPAIDIIIPANSSDNSLEPGSVEANTGTWSPRQRVVSICSDGSYVSPPSACPRQS